MEPIYPISSLQKNPSEVKEKAKENLVRITEQGAAAYIFCSEEAFERRVQQERDDAAYEALLLDSVGRGIADIEAGRFTTSIDEAFRKAAALRKRYA